MTPTDPCGTQQGSDLRLRAAHVGDVDGLAALHLRARAAAPMPPHVCDVDALAADLASGLLRDHLWVAELDGVTAGYVRFVSPDAERVGWLDDLYVDPEHARRGIGAALLATVQAHLPGGFGLWVFARNLPARRFYAAHGLLEVEDVPAEESPTGEAEVRMQWPGRDVPAPRPETVGGLA